MVLSILRTTKANCLKGTSDILLGGPYNSNRPLRSSASNLPSSCCRKHHSDKILRSSSRSLRIFLKTVLHIYTKHVYVMLICRLIIPFCRILTFMDMLTSCSFKAMAGSNGNMWMMYSKRSLSIIFVFPS